MTEKIQLWCGFLLMVFALPSATLFVCFWIGVHMLEQMTRFIGCFQAVLEYVWYRKRFKKWLKQKPADAMIEETL